MVNMTHVQTDLIYSYEPAGFFESEVVIETPSGTLKVGSGKAILTLSHPVKVSHAMAEQITDIVRGVFSAQQLFNHMQFELREHNVLYIGPDDHREISILVKPAHFKLTTYPVDIRLTDATGRVIKDSRAERIAQQSKFVQNISTKLSNPALLRMLASYNAAVNDSTNELVHLFEILDALIDHFGKEGSARSALDITKEEWDRIGKLANGEPILEGRHRGNKPSLRPATDDELLAARKMAFKLIERFADSVTE